MDKQHKGAGRQPLPVGVDMFTKICEGGYYYVDKTLLIKSVIDYGAEAVLFTRPRRFGKSLNMDMLRTFFEISEEDTARVFQGQEDLGAGRQIHRSAGTLSGDSSALSRDECSDLGKYAV